MLVYLVQEKVRQDDFLVTNLPFPIHSLNFIHSSFPVRWRSPECNRILRNEVDKNNGRNVAAVFHMESYGIENYHFTEKF